MKTDEMKKQKKKSVQDHKTGSGKKPAAAAPKKKTVPGAGTSKGGTGKGGISKGGAAKAGPSKTNPSKTNPSKAGPSKTGPSKASPSRGGGSKAVLAKPEKSRTGYSPPQAERKKNAGSPGTVRSIRVAATTSTGSKLRVVMGNADSGGGRGGKGLQSLRPRGPGRGLIAAGIFLFLLLIASGVLFYIGKHYHVETIYVEGNVHYTNEEIIQMVTSERLGDNSLYLSLKYKNKGIRGIPFIENMDVKVLAPDTIKIVVYEKAVAGYVEYLDKYMYFDKDGTVVEASDAKTAGIPQVTGIPFNQVVLYEPLPVDNQEVFKEILYMTQILSKYEISADKIYFDDSYEMTLYFGDVRVKLGNDDNVEEKISRLKQILPAAAGTKGVFHMENYSGSGSNVTFEQDK
mgnify:CR=1 FL=1